MVDCCLHFHLNLHLNFDLFYFFQYFDIKYLSNKNPSILFYSFILNILLLIDYFINILPLSLLFIKIFINHFSPIYYIILSNVSYANNFSNYFILIFQFFYQKNDFFLLNFSFFIFHLKKNLTRFYFFIYYFEIY